MSSKDKDKTLQDKLKQFFRLNKGGSGNCEQFLVSMCRLNFAITFRFLFRFSQFY